MELAEAALAALDRHDVPAFLDLCDDEVELIQFTSSERRDELSMRELRNLHYDHVHGRAAVGDWWQAVFDLYPEMAFALRHVDVIGQSAVCDTGLSLADGHAISQLFVLTIDAARIVGFEVFHGEVAKRRILNEDCTLFVGEFRVHTERAEALTPFQPCAWVALRQDDGESCWRFYPDETAALKALGPAAEIRPEPPTRGLDQTNGSSP